MRTDIKINTQTHDLVLHNIQDRMIYPFEWLDDTGDVIKGQIVLPGDYEIQQLQKTGVIVHIPYTPVYKPIQIKIYRDYGGGNIKKELNPKGQGEWFDVQADLYHLGNKDIKASELLAVNFDGMYLITLDGGIARIWSGDDSDLRTIDANIQNRNLLLQCSPSNSYRYPISGVGLIRYLHSNGTQNGLANRLNSEFEKDGVIVEEAAFDPETGELDLKLDFLNTHEDL